MSNLFGTLARLRDIIDRIETAYDEGELTKEDVAELMYMVNDSLDVIEERMS